MTELIVEPTVYYFRLTRLFAHNLNHRPVHILVPQASQPYSAKWRMFCDREIHHTKGVTQFREAALRDWSSTTMCVQCVKKAPMEYLPPDVQTLFIRT